MLNRQNSKTNSALQTSRTDISNNKATNPEQDIKLVIKVDKEDYYEGEVINGTVRLHLQKETKPFLIRLSIFYEEHYVLFNEDGDTALVSKDFKEKLVKKDIECKETYQAGEHTFQFGIKLPSSIKNGTFYHAGKSLSARIAFSVQAKFFDRIVQNKEQKAKSIKNYISIRINNHFKYVTIQKVLYDEGNVSKFMCFGGGVVTVEAEYVRDTFCINPAKFLFSHNQSGVINSSALYQGDIDPHELPENIIEMRFQCDNRKNKLKVDEVLVQLLQIVVIKQGENDGEDMKVLKHVQEVLYSKRFEAVYPGDYTDKPRPVKISLTHIQKALIKRQEKEGIYGQLSRQEVIHSRGIQQTSTGKFVENFYILRVKAVINQDLFNSPYVDCQLFFAYHDVPAVDLGESQLIKMEEAQEKYIKELEDKAESVHIRTNSIAFHNHEDNVVHNFQHFHQHEHGYGEHPRDEENKV